MADAKFAISAEDKTRAAFESVKRNLSDMERTASTLRATFAGIGAGLSAAALVGFVRTAIDAADGLGKLSQKVGVTVESLSELQYAGRLADVSTEQLGDGLRKLSVNLQEAAGGSKEFQSAFAAVGISANELITLKPDQALARIADAFARSEDGAAKTAIAVKLFGRAGSELIPLLNQGSAGLRDAADEARRFGLIISSDAARAAETFNDNLTRLSSSAQSLGITLANAVLPKVTQFTNELLEGEKVFGSFGSAFAAIVTNVNPFKDINTNLRETRQNIEKIRAQLEAIPSGAYRLRESLSLDLDEQIRVKEYLEARQRAGINTGDPSTFDARDLAARQGGGRGTLPTIKVDKTTKKKGDDLTDAERFARQTDDERYRRLDQFLTDLQRQREDDERELIKKLQEGPEEAAKQADELRKSVDSLMAASPAGKRDALNRQIGELNERLIEGKISAEEYEDVFAGLSKNLSNIKDIGDDVFDSLSFSTDKWLEDLRFAAEGWGRSFSTVLADAALDGRLAFEDIGNFAKGVFRDILALSIQRSIAEPLIKAGVSALGSIFAVPGTSSSKTDISGFADGGVPPVGRASIVGERGPELFVPSTAGRIIPNNALGGNVTIVQYIDSRTDLASIATITRTTERRILDQLATRR